MRVHFLTSALVLGGLATGCFVPVQEEDLNGQLNGESSTPSASGSPDSGDSTCGAACVTDAGAPMDAGGVFDAGASTPDAGPASDAGAPIDAGAPDAGQSVPDAGPCQPGTAGCWNQGCAAPDAGAPPPGGYCAPCAQMCDCAMGPDGYVGVCLNTPTGMWCTWACDFQAPWQCPGNSKCLEVVPGDEGSAVCVPYQADGPCS